jgi:alpha-tubulin suppressor-like RCC1 family protein
MPDDKKITDLDRATPLGSFDFVSATGVDNYKVSYSNLAEYSSIAVQSGTFTESLTVSGVAVLTGTSPGPSTEGLIKWTDVPASTSAPGVTGDVAYDTSYFYACTPLPSFAVTDIFSSDDDHIFLTAAGDAYGYGINAYGELGYGDSTWLKVPTYITGLNEGSSVTGVTMAKFTNFFLTPAGDVYGCGFNSMGQLGLGHSVAQGPKVPTYITGLSEGSAVTGISNAYSDSLFLTTAGDVYGCGDNGQGQLGLGDTTRREWPTYMTGSAQGTAVAATFSTTYNSFFLTAGGDAYGCGLNDNHLLGLGPHTLSTQLYMSPMRITGGVTDISTSHEHTMFLTTAGDVYANGVNSYGVLGDGTTTTRDWPTYITGSAQGSAVTAILSTYYNSFFLTAAGDVYGCGYNQAGQLGLGDITQRELPTLITGGVSDFCGAAGTTSFLTPAGDVYSCGVSTTFGYPLSHPNLLYPTFTTGAGSSIGVAWTRAPLSVW